MDGGLIEAIRALYRKPTSAVVVNGVVSGDFEIQTGVRQGCPLSPLLYVIAFDGALMELNDNKNVVTIPLPTRPQKALVAYADDLTIVAKSEESVRETLLALGEWGRRSGATINKNKCACMYVGGQRGQGIWTSGL